MPYDATVLSIYGSISNWVAFAPTTIVFPYVIIATAPANSNTFTITTGIETTTTTPYVSGTSYPAETILTIATTFSNPVILPTGTRIAVCCAIRHSGSALVQSYVFYYTGGVLFGE